MQYLLSDEIPADLTRSAFFLSANPVYAVVCESRQLSHFANGSARSIEVDCPDGWGCRRIAVLITIDTGCYTAFFICADGHSIAICA